MYKLWFYPLGLVEACLVLPSGTLTGVTAGLPFLNPVIMERCGDAAGSAGCARALRNCQRVQWMYMTAADMETQKFACADYCPCTLKLSGVFLLGCLGFESSSKERMDPYGESTMLCMTVESVF